MRPGYAAGITCAEMVCEWKDIKAPKCDIVEYQVFGLSWTWTCYRVACFFPLGSELWKYPPVGEYDHQPNWDFDQLKKDAQKDCRFQPKGSWKVYPAKL